MDVRALGFRTDLMMRRLGGSVIDDRGDHLVVRTPHNPRFFWGNFLLVPSAPGAAELERWLAEFGREFPDAPHIAIGVDGVDGDAGDRAAIAAAGLEVDAPVVLTAPSVAAPRPLPEGMTVRALRTDADWSAALPLRTAVYGDDGGAETEFMRAKIREERAMVEGGHGVYLGAFSGDVLAGALGIFTDGAGLARYQNVETHPDFRRRGVAAHLVVRAGEIGLGELGASTLVIVADPDDVAIRLYRSLGFVDVEHQVNLQRTPAAPPA